MAVFNLVDLKEQYMDFRYAQAEVEIAGKNLSEDKKSSIFASELEVENTCGFEASVARFSLYNTFDLESRRFLFDDFKKYVYLGSSVKIFMGYGGNLREVFRGFISRVRFSYSREDVPGVEVTAMDIKGIMMANCYSKQLKSDYFSDAVKELFEQSVYQKLIGDEITNLTVDSTPDKPEGGGEGAPAAEGAGEEKEATDKSIEMVAESDYEFVVKAAKKFNYEFYSVSGDTVFRKAKGARTVLMEIYSGALKGVLLDVAAEYDITGLVGKIEVRGVDVGKARMVSSKKSLNNKLSMGNKAKPLVSGQNKIYVDPTVHSNEEAGFRADYLAEELAYRLGTLEAVFVGLPEMTPGYFVKFIGFGTGVDNTYYITDVTHIMDTEHNFITKVKAKAASVDGSAEEAGI